MSDAPDYKRLAQGARFWIDALVQASDIEPSESVFQVLKHGNDLKSVVAEATLEDFLNELDAAGLHSQVPQTEVFH